MGCGGFCSFGPNKCGGELVFEKRVVQTKREVRPTLIL